MNVSKRAASLSGSDNSHSQTTQTRQPSALSRRRTSLSLLTFSSNFLFQNSTLDFGVRVLGHLGCRCQKQPWINTTVRHLGSVTSGLPGSSFLRSRKRYPSRWRMRRTAISGRVSAHFTNAMISERRLGVTESTLSPCSVRAIPSGQAYLYKSLHGLARLAGPMSLPQAEEAGNSSHFG